MKAKQLVLVLSMVCLLAGAVLTAVTGKITGLITDSQTKEPLVGVSVQVVGTTMGGITDAEGRYTILNVPVGTYTLKMSIVGYAELQVDSVEVSADLATYQDHGLSSQAADIGKTIQVTAERPLVVQDKTTSINIMKRDEILALPTRGFEQIVGLQNSVVRMKSNVDLRQRGQREATGAGNTELNLRGGRPSEVAYYVDGFSQQDPLSGISTANISNNAIKEVSVVAGAFSAEYGHVSSGIVNVVTNSGTDKYRGTLELVTDNIRGSSHSFDHNYYAGDFSGPLPLFEKGSFYFSGERRYLGDREPSSRTRTIAESYGYKDLFGERFHRQPNNSQSGWSGQGKIDYPVSPNFKLQFSGNYSVDNWREYRHTFVFGQHHPRYEDQNIGLNAKVTHTLDARTFYNLSVSYFRTYRLRADNEAWDNIRFQLDRGGDPEEDDQNLFNDPDGYWPNYLKRDSRYIGFKGDITHRVADHHTFKSGFDFQRHSLRYYEHLEVYQGDDDLDLINRYGYDLEANETDTTDFRSEARHPINLGIYLEDRFDFQGLIVNGGLRFDMFDYNALRIKNPAAPLGDPNLPGNTTLDLSDLEDSKTFTRLSPRLGIAFPISDKTQMHVNYGKFFQRPDLRRLYTSYRFFQERISAGSYYPFPSPNLEPEKTTQYEAGLTHQISDFTAFEITAYYKDVQDLTQIYHQSPAAPNEYDVFANLDYGTIRGLDLGLTMRRNRNITFDLRYTLAYASGTGSYAQSRYIIAWQNPKEPMKLTAPLDYDQRHSITAIFDWRTGKGEGPKLGDVFLLQNTGLNILVQAASGTPYTPVKVGNEITLAAYTPQPIGGINSANLPWTMSVDMKLERNIKLGNFSVVPYLWVKNLLDRDNILAVYEGTGKAEETGYLDTEPGQAEINADPEFLQKYLLAQDNPKNWGQPRMILFGLRMSF